MRAGSELTTEARGAAAAKELLDSGTTKKYQTEWPAANGPQNIVLGGLNAKLVVGHAPDVLTIGADPELEVLNTTTNEIINAGEMLRRKSFYACIEHPDAHGNGPCAAHNEWLRMRKIRKSNPTAPLEQVKSCASCSGDCGTCNVGTHNTRNGRVGLDSGERVLELRPRAQLSATGFLREMHDLMYTVTRRCATGWGPDFVPSSWPFGGRQESIGAHIHIGGARACELGGSGGSLAGRERFFDTALGAVLATRYFVLDWLAPFARSGVRVGNQYDTSGATPNSTLANCSTPTQLWNYTSRLQQWGLEYRELPGFLVSPKLVKAVASAMLGIWGRALGDEEHQVVLGRNLFSFESAGVPATAARALLEEVVRLYETYSKVGKTPSIPKEWGVELSASERVVAVSLRPTPPVVVQCGMCDVCLGQGVPHSTTPHEARECSYAVCRPAPVEEVR